MRALLAFALISALAGGCAAHRAPSAAAGVYDEVGIASWYGPKFHGRKTASGEVFNMYALTAAHRTLPLGVRVRVTNLENGKSVIVRINDRGPFVKGRLIDLSYAAAKRLGFVHQGTARVRVQSLGPVHNPRSASGKWVFVQIGAFRDRGAAARISARYAALAPVQIQRHPDRALFRVRLGPVPVHRLSSLLRRLKQDGLAPIVVHE